MPPYRPPLPPRLKPRSTKGTVPKLPVADYVHLTRTHRQIAHLLSFVRAEPAASLKVDPAKVAHVDMTFLKFIPAFRYNNPRVRFTYTKVLWLSEEEKLRQAKEEELARMEAGQNEAERREYIASGRAALDEAQKELEAAMALAAARKAKHIAAAEKKTKNRADNISLVAKLINNAAMEAKEKEARIWPALSVDDPNPLLTVTFGESGGL
ncbi:MAG: hypothetical protein BJ554DRAFT_4406 [Olpidium bornovanus]|uniref:Uncharacterized protein n=1 Tax=Olpidium bornovanus TaxID=278681 RepID=A0A8H8DER3_9FUNG|nr:MAG: hypothetical protein BJ554DRAFT_4406 [Olpidium bornovanus]